MKRFIDHILMHKDSLIWKPGIILVVDGSRWWLRVNKKDDDDYRNFDADLEWRRLMKDYQSERTFDGRMPPDIRICCVVLGVPFEHLSIDAVQTAWGTRMSDSLAAHEVIDRAKLRLVDWLRGADDVDRDQPSRVPRRPLPSSGSAAIELPLLKDESWEED